MSHVPGRRSFSAAVLVLCPLLCAGCQQEPVRREDAPIVVLPGVRAPHAAVPARSVAAVAAQAPSGATAAPDEDPPLMLAAESAAREADLYRTAEIDPAALAEAAHEAD